MRRLTGMVAITLILFVFCQTRFGFFADESASNDMVTVEAEGFGESQEEAKLSALKEAVRKVVGELVDAETRVTQERVIEKILIASRGSLEKHEVLSSGKGEDELWTVKVRAMVKRTALIERLKARGVQYRQVDGANMIAQMEFNKGQNAENLRFLAKYFKDNQFPYSLINVDLSEGMKVVENNSRQGDDDTKDVLVTVKVRPNMEKYRSFTDGLKQILEKLASRKFPATMNTVPWEKDTEICPNARMCFSYGIQKPKEGTIIVLVFQSQIGKLKSSKWMAYELPEDFCEFFMAHTLLIPVVNLSLHDENGGEIFAKILPLATLWKKNGDYIYNFCPMTYNFIVQDNYYIARHYGTPPGFSHSTVFLGGYPTIADYKKRYFRNTSKCIFTIGPMAFTYKEMKDIVYPTVDMPISFSMTANEIRAVTKMGIEIIKDNPEMDAYYESLEKAATIGTKSDGSF